MNIVLVSHRNSGSASRIAEALSKLGHGAHISVSNGGHGWGFPQGTLVVNWGTAGNYWPADIKILNPRVLSNKQTQLHTLGEGGVNIPPISTSPREGFLPRKNRHSEGKDIMKCLRGEESPDFFTEFIPTTHETRFHVFGKRSIRCGVKRAIHSSAAHPNIRSHRNGWNIVYGESALREAGLTPDVQVRARLEAIKAIGVLGLDFGAVDVGIQKAGSPIVFEVNHAPGVEGRMAELYAENIIRRGGKTS
jgi:hypothetical protein